MNEARFILSKSKVLEQYCIMKGLADHVSYSFKTNIEVGKVLEEHTDSMFSVHTLDEMDLVKCTSRAWFIAQSLTEQELDCLFEKNIFGFIIDNLNDLNLLLDYLNKHHKKTNLLLRIRLRENTIHTGKYFVFGFYSQQINRLIPELRGNPNLNQLGIHFHRKTQNIAEWSLKEELQEAISSENFKLINIINIGGGIPCKYKNFRAEVMEHIFSKIRDLKLFLNQQGIQMIIEPGRFIAAPSVKLETTITNIYDNTIIVNCSVYNSAMDTFVAHIRLLVEGELEKGISYTLKGSTPCSMDIFRYSVFLDNPKVGDRIVFSNAGAYNFATDFCNLKKLRTIIVD
jgi:ornithine decarboxylase